MASWQTKFERKKDMISVKNVVQNEAFHYCNIGKKK
jgi:hypothetical protein